MKNIFLCLALLVGAASGQAVRYDNVAQGLALGNVFVPIANGTVIVYNFPGAGVNCAASGTCTLATTFVDDIESSQCTSPTQLTGSTSNTCTGTADAGGNFGFWVAPGAYQYCVSGTGFTSQCTNINLSFQTSNVNNILYVDGQKYSCTSPGIAALLSAAVGQANAEGCLSGFTSTSEIDIGSAIKTGISLIHPSTSTWTFNFNNSSACGVKIFDGTSFTGRGSAASSNGAFTMTFPGTANLAGGLCTNLTGANYTAAENIRLYSPNGALFTNGLFDVENNVDSSWFRNIVVANYSGVGLFWWDNCCSASTYNIVSNGNYGANALPFWLKSDITHNDVASYFYATSLGHPGVGKNNLLLTGLNRYWCNGHGFYGLYLEGASGIGDTTTPAIDDNCYGGTSFYDATMANDDPVSTRYLLQIETGVGGVNAFNIESGISTNIINDIANGITVTTTPSAFPGYQPINYISIPTWMPFLHIGGASGGPGGIFNRNLLFSASQPTLGSGFGTSPSIPTNNGDTAFSINVGTGGTATTGTINFNATAQNRWNVHCDDRTTYTTTVFKTRQTASTTTSATIGNFNSSAVAAAWASGDIIDCIAAAE